VLNNNEQTKKNLNNQLKSLYMLKTLLISGAVVSASVFCAQAQNKSYFTDTLGEVNGVADNGKYAAIGDTENNIAYFWSAENPDVFTNITPDLSETADLPDGQRISGALAYDVTNDGLVVAGTLFYADGHSVPAIYTDGEWTPLQLHASSMNTNEAIAITPDGKTICGYSFIYDKGSDIGGRFYPCQWTLGADGTYGLHAYTDIELPDHQGFYPLTQSPDGKVIAGEVFCGAGSIIPAMVVEGEFRIFDNLETKMEPWIYKGKYYCGDDENGKQIWSEDPNDPRIVLFPEYYINGWHDTGESTMSGMFASCDGQGNYYGQRTLVSNVDEEGNADLKSMACIYNVNTDEWTYNESYAYFTAGVGKDLLFADSGKVLVDGKAKFLDEEYEIDSPSPIAGVNKISINGKVLGCMRYEINPASGEPQYFPFITVSDGAFSGLSQTFGGEDRASFIVSGRTISVRNADSMDVYDLNGCKVATGTTADVEAGIYMVKAGAVTAKIQIR